MKVKPVARRLIESSGSALKNVGNVVISLAVSMVLRVLIASLVGGMLIMAAPLIVRPAEVIGGFLAGACSSSTVCDWATVYVAFGLALYLLAVCVLIIGYAIQQGFEDISLTDGKDENIPDIVADELLLASKPLTGMQLAARTGLERTVVQQCVECLIEDGRVERVISVGINDQSSRSRCAYRLADERS